MKLKDIHTKEDLNNFIIEYFTSDSKLFQEYRVDDETFDNILDVFYDNYYEKNPRIVDFRNSVLIYEHNLGILILIKDQ